MTGRDGISEREARARNRAWPPFKYWLQARTIAELERVDAEQLALLHWPIPADQLAASVAARLRQLHRAAKAGKPAAKIV